MAFESLVTQRAEPHFVSVLIGTRMGAIRQMQCSSGGRGSTPNHWDTPSAICITLQSARRDFNM